MHASASLRMMMSSSSFSSVRIPSTCACTGIEQNFLKQEVIFAQYAFGNGHVALESSSRCVLMFHDGGKHESGYERNGQRIGHGFIMFFETVFKDVQAEAW